MNRAKRGISPSLFSSLNRREILRFAQNDKMFEEFLRSLFKLNPYLKEIFERGMQAVNFRDFQDALE